MSKNKNELQLRVPLKGVDLVKFLKLKKKFGLTANTEVVRFILNKVAEEVAAT